MTFLLNGRTVLLETSRPNGAKIITHMLTSYGGEIFMQTVHTVRGAFEIQSFISNELGSIPGSGLSNAGILFIYVSFCKILYSENDKLTICFERFSIGFCYQFYQRKQRENVNTC